MGFAPERVDWALHATNSGGLQAALDHLEAHQDEPMPENWKEAAADAGASGEAAGTEGPATKVRATC